MSDKENLGVNINLKEINEGQNYINNKEKNTDLLNKKIKQNFENTTDDNCNPNKDNLKNIKDIQLSNKLVIDPSYSFGLNHSFSVFKSINDEKIYLVYTNFKRSIISYNLTTNQKAIEIRNAHKKLITNFRYCADEINERDLILSISCDDNNIKLWNVNKWECIFNIQKLYNNGKIYSACFLNDNNNISIIITNFNIHHKAIKFYSLNGDFIKEITNISTTTCFIDTYYDKRLSKKYILTNNETSVVSFNYDDNIYKIYDYKNRTNNYYNYNFSGNVIVINKDICGKNKEELIASCLDGNIRIWDFQSANFIKMIKIEKYYLSGICLWNNDYILSGCADGKMRLIDLNEYSIIRDDLINENCLLIYITTIFHPLYGECLFTHGKNNQIKLWIKN